MLPASATRPDAVTMALLEATWPLLMPIETLVPFGQAEFDRGDLHVPCAVKRRRGGRRGDRTFATINRMRVAITCFAKVVA